MRTRFWLKRVRINARRRDLPLKKQSDLSRLIGYAGKYRAFTYASWVLSALSALLALVPFLYIWMILRDTLDAASDYAQAVNIPHYGWMAVLFAALSFLVYVCVRSALLAPIGVPCCDESAPCGLGESGKSPHLLNCPLQDSHRSLCILLVRMV